MPVQTRAQRRQRSRAVNEAGLDKVWALIGVQSLLCTLAFLALLYLNFQIWHQYFFLILWAFILSHAFKAALDDLQAWADDLANGVAQASRKEVLCRCCWGLFHRHDQRASPEQQHTSLLQRCVALPGRFCVRLYTFAGNYGLYFFFSTYVFYWFLNYVCAVQKRPHLLLWHVGYVSVCVLPLCLLLIGCGGPNVAHCVRHCCGNPIGVVSQSGPEGSGEDGGRTTNNVNPCGAKLLILFTVCSASILSTVMIFHSLYDIAFIGSHIYGEINRSAHVTASRVNYGETEFRATVNGILDAPLSSARETYANQTWWPIVEDVWGSVKKAGTPSVIWTVAHESTERIYGNETWWPYVDPYFDIVPGWFSGSRQDRRGKGEESGGGGGSEGSGGSSGDQEDGCENERQEGGEEAQEQCEQQQHTDKNGVNATPTSATTTMTGQDEETLASYVRDSVWKPFLNTYMWVSENNATVSDILIKTKDVGGGILGGTIGLIFFFLTVVGSTLGMLGTTIVFFLFLNTMLTNDVDELRVVVLLLYPVTSWNSARGKHKILTITNSLRRSFEGVLFVPLSLSSLYASHQLLSMSILGLPGAGLACLLTFLLSLTHLLSTFVGLCVSLPWMIMLGFNGDWRLWPLLVFHLMGMNCVEATVMSANQHSHRIKSPYLTAFALYLGVNVFGLPGLLVGPLGLSVLTVLYESMLEEELTTIPGA